MIYNLKTGLYTDLSQKKYLSLLVLLFSAVIFAYLLKSIIFNAPVVHPEFIETAVFMTTPAPQYKMDLYKILDLSATEKGMYRPRLLSFLFQYIDSNFILFTRHFSPQFGFHLLGYYIALCLIVFTSLRFVKQLLPNSPLYLRLLFALMPLVWLNTFGTLMVTLRSAKLLCVPCIIYIFSVFIQHRTIENQFKRSSQIRLSLYYSTLFAIFYLIDEQITSFTALFTICAISESLLERKIHLFVIYGIGSLIIYCLLYYTVLKSLFGEFTPGLNLTHVHHSGLLISNFSWTLMKAATSKYLWVIINNFSFLLLFLAASLIKQTKGLTYQASSKISTIVILLIGSFINTLTIALMHPPIATYPDLKVMMYYLPLLSVFYCLLLYTIKDFFLNDTSSLACVLGVMLVLSCNVIRFNHVFNTVKNGHLAQFKFIYASHSKKIIEASRQVGLETYYSSFCKRFHCTKI